MPPLDPASLRLTQGQYAARRPDGRCAAPQQWSVRQSGREPASRPDSGARTLAVLYAVALLSQQVALVGNSTRRPPGRMRNVLQPVLRSAMAGRCTGVSSEAAPTAPSRQRWLPGVVMAAAGEVSTAQHFHAQHRLFIVKDDAVKSLVFTQMAQLLLQDGSIDQALADHLMLAWRSQDMGMPICVAPVSSELLHARDKRISKTNHDSQVMAHIEQNCAVETEILDSAGLSEGKLLIFMAQRAENPFRMIYDNRPPEEVSGPMRGLAGGLNFFADVITLGIKPAIGGLLAAHYRRRYFDGIHDDICSTRQRHLAFALLATSLDVRGVTLGGLKPRVMQQPLELAQQVPFASKAAYFSHNKATGVHRELLLTATHPARDASGPVKMMVNTNVNSELVVHHAVEASTNKLERRIIYDEQRAAWRYADGADLSALKLEIEEGEACIMLSGNRYPVRQRPDGEFDIVVNRADGSQDIMAVYRDPLSKTWHLHMENHHPVFTQGQRSLIARLQVTPNQESRYSMAASRYVRGNNQPKIFEVRNRHDDVFETAPLYLVLELDGVLVPVRMALSEKQGIHYQIYDIAHPMGRSYTVEWDGNRWRFERWTSPHVSLGLFERVTEQMFATVDEGRLSTPDQQGVKWTDDQRGFLKIRRRYVELHKGAQIYLVGPDGSRIVVRYRKNQFHPLPSSRVLGETMSDVSDQRMDDMLDMLKGQSKDRIQDGFDFLKIEQVTKTIFFPEEPQLEQVPSNDVDTRRYSLLSDAGHYFIQTNMNGQDLHILLGADAALAEKKLEQRMLGGIIKQTVVLRRSPQDRLQRSETRAQIKQDTIRRIEQGAKTIAEVLDRVGPPSAERLILVVGHADFLQTSMVENNVFASAETVFRTLFDYFILLSEAHPGVIIIPGSIYISEDVPTDLLGRNILFSHQGRTRAIDNLVNFSAVLVPVFYNGTLVTMGRKGNYLCHEAVGRNPASGVVRVTDLQETLPSGVTLQLSSEPLIADAEALTSNDGNNDDSNLAHTGSIFAGRTLLPTEAHLAGWYFQGSNSPDIPSDRPLFENVFTIKGEKFLLVIEDELTQEGQAVAAVKRLVQSPGGAAEDGTRFDWIIHPSAGQEIAPDVRKLADNYLQADLWEDNILEGQHAQWLQQRSYNPERDLIVYDYTLY